LSEISNGGAEVIRNDSKKLDGLMFEVIQEVEVSFVYDAQIFSGIVFSGTCCVSSMVVDGDVGGEEEKQNYL
jgi:hypothetical protein